MHNLTLNLGIRYEIQTPYTSRHNEGSIFDPTALNPLSYSAGIPLLGALQFLGPGNRYVYDPNYHNIAPRCRLLISGGPEGSHPWRIRNLLSGSR